jgi:hypothetical protein
MRERDMSEEKKADAQKNVHSALIIVQSVA